MNREDRKFLQHHMGYITEVNSAMHEAAHCACAILVIMPIVRTSLQSDGVGAWTHVEKTDSTTVEDLIVQAMGPVIAAERWALCRGGLGEDLETIENYLMQLPVENREETKERLRATVRFYVAKNEVGIFRIAHELQRHRNLDGATVKALFTNEAFGVPRRFLKALRLLPELEWEPKGNTASPELLARWFEV